MKETVLDGKTLDIAEENIQKLRKIFPDVFTEDKVDFEKLQQVLGEYVEDSNERYNFTWNGKGQALRLSQAPSLGTLRPCKEESKDWDTTQNLYIEGDNLEVLKLLQKSYHSKVKMIYIDPPYNTGGDFVYPDDFHDSLENYKKLTGQVDSEGNRLSTNTESSGRYHTDWLNMMYPRLRLARNLLSDDGVLFVSIDDNEVDNLKKICNEVFGEDNFIAQIMSVSNPGGRDYKQIAVMHEYILIYAKSGLTELNEIQKDIKFSMFDDNGGYELRELRNRNPKFHRGNRPNLFYAFYINAQVKDEYGCCAVSVTKEQGYDIGVCPYNSIGIESVWRWGKPKSTQNIDMLNIKNSNIVARQKNDGGWNIYEKNRKSTTKAKSIWDETNMRTEDGTRLVRLLFDKTLFDHPKSLALLKRCCQLATEEDSIILDFFSGSSTTAHATMQLNAEDGGNRKFIMVQLPEETDEKSEAYKAGYMNICEIGKERIRRAGEKIKEENKDKENIENLDIGFKVLKLDTSNIRKWQPDYDNLEQSLLEYIDNFVEVRTELDVVYEIMLKYGLDLTYPVDEFTIAQKKVYSIGFGMLMICLDDEITTDVAKGILGKIKELSPESSRVVFKDNGFKTDSNKTNIKEILKSGGIEEFITI